VDYQKLLLQHLELIDRVLHYIARRHHLSAAETEEFASFVHFKLIDRNFAILRKFQGRSNLGTYLTTVIERLYLDFCISRWGKWRASAAARRLGPTAMLLERMLGRDGMTFDEAVGTLRTNHGITATRSELQAMLARLPARPIKRFAGEEELALVASRAGAPDAAFDQSDDQALVDRIEARLAVAVAALPASDQLLVKLHFLDNVAVARIARMLQTDAKPLYRRLDQIISLFRAQLKEEGIDLTEIDRIVSHPALNLGRLFGELPGMGDRNDGSV
jgi:RNA polymerase sigma factor (sigma-70 family)